MDSSENSLDPISFVVTLDNIAEKLENQMDVAAAWDIQIPQHQYTDSIKQHLSQLLEDLCMQLSYIESLQRELPPGNLNRVVWREEKKT